MGSYKSFDLNRLLNKAIRWKWTASFWLHCGKRIERVSGSPGWNHYVRRFLTQLGQTTRKIIVLTLKVGSS